MPEAPAVGDTLRSYGPVADLLDGLTGGQAWWLVGGAVRDALLAREVHEADLAVAGDSHALAQRAHQIVGGSIFSLSDRFGTWRVVSHDLQVDLTPLRGDSIEADLVSRDFTVNALAVAGDDRDGRVIDPLGGLADLEGRRLRLASETAYQDDPLRTIRLARFAAQLGFEPDAQACLLARGAAAKLESVAGERVWFELKSLVTSAEPRYGLEVLRETGVLSAALPELDQLAGVEQSVYHHLDVYDHTLEVLDRVLELEREPESVFTEDGAVIAQALAEPLADGMTRAQALRFGALLHDVGKFDTRAVYGGGRVGFPNHDRRGAEMIRVLAKRMRTSDRTSSYLASLAEHHLVLGFAAGRELSRSDVYGYLSRCSPVELDVTVLSVADRLATRGRKADQAIARHIELARRLAREALSWREFKSQPPLVRGDLLAAELGIETGPALGDLLATIDRARFTGDLTTAEDAIAFAHKTLALGG